MTDRATWPDLLRRIAELVGDELALRLAGEHGGLDNVYIPKSPTETHPWASVLGPEAWALVVAEYGGERVSLPRGARLVLKKVEILELAEQGLSRREIARRSRTTERHVRRILGLLTDPAQTALPFDEPADG